LFGGAFFVAHLMQEFLRRLKRFPPMFFNNNFPF